MDGNIQTLTETTVTKYNGMLYPNSFIWNETLQKYIVTVSAETMGFSGNNYITAIKVMRKENATAPWRNVIFQYEVDTSGNILLYFDVVFTGRIKVVLDEY